MANYTLVMLTCGKPSPFTGRVYSRDAMEEAIATFNKKYPQGQWGTVNRRPIEQPIPIEDISHKVTSVTIDKLDDTGEDRVMATIETLRTPAGALLEQLLNSGSTRISPAMVGTIAENDDGQLVVTNIEIVSTSFEPIINQQDINNETKL